MFDSIAINQSINPVHFQSSPPIATYRRQRLKTFQFQKSFADIIM